MPTSSNPYDAILEEDESRLRAQQSATLSGAVGVQPDAFATQRNVAKYLGYPTPAVEATPEQSKREFSVKKVMDDAAGYPELQRRYSTDEFAKLAHDDSVTLAGIGGQVVKGAKYLFGANQDSNTLGGDIVGGYHQAAAGTAGVFRAGAELGATAAEGLVPGLRVAEEQNIAGGDPLRRLAEGFGLMAADSNARAKAASPEAKGIIAGGVSSGVQSTVGNLLMLPLALLPGGEAAALYGMSAQQGGQSYQRAREAGIDQWTALNYGLSDATIEYVTEKLPLHNLMRDLGKGKSLFRTAANQLLPEVIGEQAATALQDLNEWAVMPANKDKTFKDYLADRPAAAAQTLIATLVGVGGQVGVMKSIQSAVDNANGKQRQIEQADAGVEHLKQLFSLAAASKLRERAPDTFADYVNETSKQTEGAPTHVYIDARTLAGEGGLLHQDKVAEILPSVAPQLAEAIATGGDVQIPIGELLANVTGTPLEQQLVEHLRTEPEGLSQAEAKDAAKLAEEFMQKEVERVMGAATDTNALATSAEKVKAGVLEQLESAKRFTPDVHDAYASLVRDFYTVTSQRLGVSPEELFARYPLRVAAVNPAGAGVQLTQEGTDNAGHDPLRDRGQPAGGKPNLRATVGGHPVAPDFATGTRLKSRGQPARLFRGSSSPLVAEHFAPGALGKATGHPTSGLGVWFTDSRDEAGRYGKVAEFHLDLRNPKYYDVDTIPEFNSVEQANAFARKLEAQGYDGLIYDQRSVGGRQHVVAFHPHQVISATGSYNQSAKPGPNANGVGLEPGNKLGFWPALRVLVKGKVPEKAAILTGTTNKNAPRPIAAIDGILAAHPDAASSVAAWSKMMSDALASNEVPVPPYRFIKDVNSGGLKKNLARLTEGQIADAAHGFENAAEFRRAYENGELGPETTGKLFLWSFLSRGVSPYTQESLFIDAFNGADKWIAKAAAGEFTEADFPEYEAWAKSVAPKGSGQPGAGATHNLNAFGQDFLLKMSRLGEDGISHMQRLHNLMSDPTQTGKSIRRQFATFGEGVGIDNKVVSFTLLVAGHSDVMVLDRVQIRQLWDDGRFNDVNLYDGTNDAEGKKISGSSLPSLVEGAKGILVYEALERALEEKLPGVYAELGRPQDASVGRYHWESWVADSQQEASHGTLGAILGGAKGDDAAISRVAAKQGEYGAYEYGATYNRDADGTPGFGYDTPTGAHFDFSVAAFRSFLADIKKPATGVIPTKFKVTESGNQPWYRRPEVDKSRLDERAAFWADRSGRPGEGNRAAEEAVRTQTAADRAGSGQAGQVENAGAPVAPVVLPSALPGGKGTLVNIGLDIPGGGTLTAGDAMAALRAAGVDVGETAVHQSDTEQTLVAQLSRPLSDAEAHAVSVALQQESIAQMTGDTGALHGPQKDKWGDFNPEYFVTLDGARASALLHQGPRGTFSPSELQISLLEGADLSTFLHETGHFFLEVMADIAGHPTAPSTIAGDMQTVLDWFGVKDLASWNAMSLDEKRPHHEKFAESFEHYLFEGKAPSHELSALFARFRSWLTNVYGSITKFLASHNTQLTDEVRQVFNRMLASEDAIREAEAAREYAPVFESAEQAGMDPVAWLAYQEQAKGSTEQAIEQLQKRSLRDMRWTTNARARALKALQRDAAAKIKATTAEVRAEVEAMPVYAVQKFVSQPENARLPDELTAEMFGFSSADEMKTKVNEAQPIEVMIEGLADRRLLERYGDLTSTQAMARAADEAVHNEARAKFVATELNALMKANRPVNVVLKAAKEFAAGLVARRKVRELKPGQHLQAETRAGRAAAKAMSSGDTKGAIVAKRDQLLNHLAARETQDAIAEVEKRVKWLRAFEKNTTLPPEYLEQIHSLLERFDLKRATNTEIDKRKSLVEWVESQRAIGIDPELPAGLLDGAQRTNYREMTVEQFRGLVDAIKQIEHLGRLKNRLLTAKDQREFDAIKTEITESIVANAKGRKADTRTPTTNLGRALQGMKNFGAAHIKAATWARVLDGGKDGGPVWEHFIRNANERGDMETTMRAKATKELTDIVAPLLKRGSMGGRGKYFASINRSLNRESVIAIALNTGNASNLQRLLGGESWTLEQLQPVLDSMTGEEWTAVQKIWDHFESYRPLIGEKEKRVYGKEPEWIPAAPREQQLPSGQTITIKGGYYPVKYDPAASVRAEEHADAEGAKRQLQGAYSAATTRRSFTKSRVEEVNGRPLLYTLAGLYSGVNDVIHDLSWHEWLIDTNRLLRSQSIDGAIRTSYGPAAVRQFKSWRDAVAEGDNQSNDALDRATGYLRQGVSVAGLGYNVMSALIQPLGITQSIVRVGAKHVARGVMQYIANPVKATRDVHARSEFMASRARTLFRELNEVRNKVQAGGNVASTAKSAVTRSAYFLMMQFQQMVDIPTWLGAYEKAIAEGNDDERSNALADQAVIDSQGSGLTKDLSAIERGTSTQKLFTVFYSFMNTASNLGFQSRQNADKTPAGRAKMAADALLLLVMPAILGKLLKNALTPGDSGDDESWKKLARVLIGEQLTYLMGLLVVTREFAEAGKSLAGLEDHPRDYQGPAGLRVISDTAAVAKQAHQGEFDDQFRKAVINVLGSALGLPSAQINRTITGVKALAEGKTKNPAAVVMGYQKPH